MAKILSEERVLEYSPEFKVKIVQLTEVEGLQASLIAEGLGLHPVMVYRWRQEYREGKLSANPSRRVNMTMNSSPPDKPAKKVKQPSKLAKDQDAENKRLRQQVARLQKENDLLKKWQRYLAEVRQSDSDS